MCSVAMVPRVIRLNVGGHTFCTARSTLDRYPYFQRLLDADFTDLDSTSGEAFIDRDGRYFHLVLNFLRSGAVELPVPPLTIEGAVAEAEFFGVDQLVGALHEQARGPIPTARPRLRADGQGIYVWEDKQQPGLIEAVLFDAEVTDIADPVPANHGTLVYSRGPCARENLLALRRMPQPLPRVWREDADASTIVAFFTQRFISRGVWEIEGRTLRTSRGTLGSDSAGPNASAQSTVATVGVLLHAEELLLLGPDGASSTSSSLLEQLGLQSAPASNAMGGLGGGFKRFHWEPVPDEYANGG